MREIKLHKYSRAAFDKRTTFAKRFSMCLMIISSIIIGLISELDNTIIFAIIGLIFCLTLALYCYFDWREYTKWLYKQSEREYKTKLRKNKKWIC